MEEEKDNDGPSDSQHLLSSPSPSDYNSFPATSSRGPRVEGEQSRFQMSPPDRYNIVYFIFYVLGLGTLLPWNFFITANDYWMHKLEYNDTTPTTTAAPSMMSTTPLGPASTLHQAEHTNNLQTIFQNTLSVCAMVPNVIFQFLNTLLQQRLSEKARIVVSIVIMILIFIATVALVKVDTSTWPEGFFGLTMVCVVILNCCSAIFQSSLFGIASNLPSRYVQALMAGQGMGGLFAALALIVSLTVSSGPLDSAFAYFLTAIGVLILTGVCYFYLLKNKYYLFHSQAVEIAKSADKAIRRDSRCEECEGINANKDVWGKSDPPDDMKETDLLDDPGLAQGASVEVKASTVPPLWLIFRQIWVHSTSVAFVFFVTLACYPSITAKVHSSSDFGRWGEVFFSPVTCFLLFNLTDWIGRTLAGHIHFPSEDNSLALLVCVFARGVFPALFALCNAHPRTSPVIFNDDAYFIVFMILFGISNGYLSTLAMQYGPKRVDAKHASTAGSMLAFAISFGLASGAAFSFVIQAVL